MEHQVLSPERRQHSFFEVVRAFLKAESRALTASALRPLWKVALGVAVPAFLVLAYCALFRRLTAPEHDPLLALTLLVLLGFSLFYGLLAGLAAGLINAGRHLVGNGFFLMLLVIGLSTLITISLCMPDLLVPTGKEAIKVLSTSAANHGLSETAAGLNGEALFTTGRFVQLWPPVEVIACPFLVTDTPQVLVDGDFLWYYFLYLRACTIAVLPGLVPSYLLSLVVLWKPGCNRVVQRYRQFVANYGVVTRYTS